MELSEYRQRITSYKSDWNKHFKTIMFYIFFRVCMTAHKLFPIFLQVDPLTSKSNWNKHFKTNALPLEFVWLSLNIHFLFPGWTLNIHSQDSLSVQSSYILRVKFLSHAQCCGSDRLQSLRKCGWESNNCHNCCCGVCYLWSRRCVGAQEGPFGEREGSDCFVCRIKIVIFTTKNTMKWTDRHKPIWQASPNKDIDKIGRSTDRKQRARYLSW